MADENRVDVEFGASTGELDGAFSKLADGAQKVGEQVKDNFDPASAAATALGVSIAGLAQEIAQKLAEALKQAIFAFSDLGGELEHMQRRIGGSAQELSGLKVALDSVGIGTSEYESIARRLPAILEQNSGKLKAAGVAYTDANGNLLSVSDTLQNITAHLEKFTAGSARNEEGMRLLGRSYYMMADMVELTKDRTEEATKVAEQFGLVMTEHDITATSEFGRQTNLLQTALHGFYVEVGRALTPAITELAEVLRGDLVPAFAVFKTVVEAIAGVFAGIYLGFVTLASGAMMLVASIALVVKLVAALALALTGQATKGFEMAKAAISDYRDTVSGLAGFVANEVDKVNAGLARMIGPTGKPKPPDGTKPQMSDAEKEARLLVVRAGFESELALQKEYLKEAMGIYADAYARDEISAKEYFAAKLAIEQAAIDASIAQKQRALGESKKKASESQDQIEVLNLLAEQKAISGQINVLYAQRNDLSRTNSEEERKAEDARTAALEHIMAQQMLTMGQAGLAQEAANSQQRLAMRQITTLQLLELQREEERRSLAITQEFLREKLEADLKKGGDREVIHAAHAAAMEAAELKHQQKLNEINNKAALERAKYAIQAQTAVQNNMSTMFEDMIKGTKSLSDAFKDFAASVIADIIRIQAQRLAAHIMGVSTSGGGGGGNTLGAAIGNWLGGSFAVGTNYVPNDMLAMVHKGERIVPASQNNPAMLGGGGQNNTVVNNFTVAGNVDTRTQAQIATLAGLAVNRALARNG